MEKGDKVAIVCCSNAIPRKLEGMLKALEGYLLGLGLRPVFGRCIYGTDSVFSGSAEERAQSLMQFYKDPEIKVVFDISGGDMANEILPFLDYDVIAQSGKRFWGYSDLTTVINAVYAKTGKPSVLYQIKHLALRETEERRRDFAGTLLHNRDDLYSFTCNLLQKEIPQGVVVGGNIRCLLKLAGTPYWPDMGGKILLLESLSGGVPQMVAYFNQLKQIGVFEEIAGLLLGTFTEMEEQACRPSVTELARQYAGENLPILKTDEIGHSIHAKAIAIGEKLKINLNIL